MAAVYASASDLSARFDERDIQQLVVDDSTSDYTVVDVTDNIRVDIALEDAEGEVVAALRKGGRYDAAALAALTGSDLAYLKRIICELTMLHLLRRRPDTNPDRLDSYEKLRLRHLRDLQNGNSILTDDESNDLPAGRPSTDGPTITEWNQQNLWRDRAKYFPQRIERQGRNS